MNAQEEKNVHSVILFYKQSDTNFHMAFSTNKMGGWVGGGEWKRKLCLYILNFKSL